MKLRLERTAAQPLYRQLAEQIREFIRCGALSPGARLPTVRQIAQEYGVTRLTVHSAYAELQAEGLVEAVVGRGTFVVEHLPIHTGVHRAQAVRVLPPPAWLSQGVMADMMRMAEQPELISFAQVTPARETFPVQEFQKALRTALDEPVALGYGPTQGELPLREQIAHLLLDRGIVCAPDALMVIAGAQQGIDLALRAFASLESVVLVEEPTYMGIIELAVQRGQRLASIPADEDGIQLAALEEACKRYHPRLLYLVPNFHNPTGRSLSQERRQALLQLARAYDLLILEDDIYGMLAYDQPAPSPLKALDNDGRVMYMLSFSKMLMPTLRLCALVASPEHLQVLLREKRSSDLLCSPLLQHALADYLSYHYLQAHLQRVRMLYRERRDAMQEALEQYLPECTWTSPGGGLCLWVRLPEQIDERELYLRSIEHGVGFAPGRAFFAVPHAQPFMRLSFGTHGPEHIRAGIRLLRDVVQEQQNIHRR